MGWLIWALADYRVNTEKDWLLPERYYTWLTPRVLLLKQKNELFSPLNILDKQLLYFCSLENHDI